MKIDEAKLKEIGAKIDAALEAGLADQEGIAFYGLTLIDDPELLDYVVIAAREKGELDAIVERGQRLHARVAWLNVYLTLRKQGFGHELSLESTRKVWPDVR